MAKKQKEADRHLGDAFFLRLPKDVAEKVVASAKQERRTRGQQIAWIIEMFFKNGANP